MTDAADSDTYALKSASLSEIAAPDLPYRPPAPKSPDHRIGMIGTGGIAGTHLDAYRAAGWTVAAICWVVMPCSDAFSLSWMKTSLT